MATLDDSPSLFSGESWSTWADIVHENGNNVEKVDNAYTENKSKDENDSMKLRREDMALYGLCPAQDEFFLAVCEKCGQVVKPQALQRHIDLRHGQKSPGGSKKKSPLISKQSLSRSHRGTKQSPIKTEKLSASQFELGHSDSFKNHSFPQIPVVKVERMSSDVFSKQQSVAASSPVDLKYEKSKMLYKEIGKVNVEDLIIKKETGDSPLLVKEEPGFTEILSSFKEEPGGDITSLDSSPSYYAARSSKGTSHAATRIAVTQKAKQVITEKKDSKSYKKEQSNTSLKVKEVSKHEKGLFREALFDRRHREFLGETIASKESKVNVSHDIDDIKRSSEKSEKNLENQGINHESDKKFQEDHLFKKVNKVKDVDNVKMHSKDSWKYSSSKNNTEVKDRKNITSHKEKEEKYSQNNNTDSDYSGHKRSSSKKDKTSKGHSSVRSKKHSNHRDSVDSIKKKQKTESENVVPHISDKSNQMYFITNIKAEKSDDAHLSSVPECVEELTRKAEPPIPEMVDEAACAVEALNSQELVDKFEKMETNIQAQIEMKHKIKFQDETHIFQIDNRSSTPILHIPSPKSEPPSTPPPLSVPEFTSSVSNGNTLSRPNSKPASRTNSRPPSRQHSQPATPLVKSETLLLEEISSQLNKLSSIQEGISFSNTTATTVPKPLVITSCVSSAVTAISAGKSSSSGVKKPMKDQKFIPCKDRIYDPEKHCGAWIADQGRHCTRSLTCKTHSLSLRRAVQGRSKSFDQLLQEHRDAKEALLKAKAAGNSSSGTMDIIPDGNRVSMATKTVTMTTTSTVMSNTGVKISPQMVVVKQHHQQQQPLNNLVTFTHTPKPAVLSVFGCTEPLPMTELGDHLSSDGEEDDDEIESTPHILSHPRPAAVNNWGSRQYGGGCYMFNQRCDLLRSAFSSIVDTHNDTPPVKKQCLESKLSVSGGIGSMKHLKDPYELSFIDSSANVIHSQQPNVIQQQNTLFSKQKSKLPITPLNKSVKHKEIVGKSLSTSSGSSSKGSASVKRKRSGSGHSMTSPPPSNSTSLSMTSLSSPISMTIPAGINILSNAAYNNTISAQLVPTAKTTSQFQQQPGKTNNLNIVVSGVDQSHQASIVNGQLLNLPSNISLEVFNNLSSMDRGHKTSTVSKGAAKLLPTRPNKLMPFSTSKSQLHAAPHHQQQHPQSLQLDLTGSNGSGGHRMVTALPTGTVLMDNTAGTFLTSSQVALTTTSTSNNNPSSATGIVFKKDSQLANGVLPHSGGLQLKNLPISINHLNSNDPYQTNSPPAAITISQDQRQFTKLHGRNHCIPGAKVSHLPKTVTATLKPSVQTQIAATLNLAQQSTGRLIAPANLQQVISPLQLQTAAGKTGPKTTTKMLQPMSLTIVTPSGNLANLAGSQTRPLLISNDTNSGKTTELSDVVSSPASVT